MTKSCKHLADLGRRSFLRGTGVFATAGVATAVGATAARADVRLARVNYPSQKLGNVKDLKVDEPMDVTYPDANSPGVLVKLGKAVEGGAGPDKDIVAFSTLCPHKGFPLSYVAADMPGGVGGAAPRGVPLSRSLAHLGHRWPAS